MYLEVSPRGGKWWRFKYRFLAKEKRISLGVYPDVSLKEARNSRDESRSLLTKKIDPSKHRQNLKACNADKMNNGFEMIAHEWLSKNETVWATSHTEWVKRRLIVDILPWLGNLPISDIDAPTILKVARRVEARGAIETAHRILGICGQIFRYGIATASTDRDPTSDLRGALLPIQHNHLSAITSPKEIGAFLNMLDGYHGTLVVKCALRLAPLVFVRPGELRHAKWADIDFELKQWRYTVTKTHTQHIVPLSHQAMAIIQELRPLTREGIYLFPSARTTKRAMSNNAICAAMRRLGIEKETMCAHGFRAMARTILDEVLGFRVDYIEHQLAHTVKDTNGRAYNRTAHLEERTKMMQAWADYLDELKGND